MTDHTEHRIDASKKRAVGIVLALFFLAGCFGILAVAYLLTIFGLNNVAIIFSTVFGSFMLGVVALGVNRLNDTPVSERLLIAIFALLGGVAVGIAIMSV